MTKAGFLFVTCLAATGVSSGLHAQTVPLTVDPTRPFGNVAGSGANPLDPIQLQTFVASLNTNDKSDLDARCGAILANLAGFPTDATAFCTSFKSALQIAPKTDADDIAVHNTADNGAGQQTPAK